MADSSYYRPADSHLWQGVIRRAFGVSDLVADEHLSEVIARQLVAAEGTAAPSDPLTERIAEARHCVLAFIAAAKANELDLAISGFGEIVPESVDGAGGKIAGYEKSAEASALSAMEAALLATDFVKDYRKPVYLQWLWARLMEAVKASTS